MNKLQEVESVLRNLMKFLGSCRPFCNSLFVIVHLENQFYDSKFVCILRTKNPENKS